MLASHKLKQAFDKIIIITDQHLNGKDETKEFVEFLQSVPDKTLLIFLGDVFQIWALRDHYLGGNHLSVLSELSGMKLRGSEAILICGNKDILYSERSSGLLNNSFSGVYTDFVTVEWNDSLLFFHHGDLINLKDRNYLRLRKMLRSSWLEMLLFFLPDRFMRNFLKSAEVSLRKTNTKGKISFPNKLFSDFILKHRSQADLFFFGHFHPEEMIRKKTGTADAFVLRAWMDGGYYYTLDKENFPRELKYETKNIA